MDHTPREKVQGTESTRLLAATEAHINADVKRAVLFGEPRQLWRPSYVVGFIQCSDALGVFVFQDIYLLRCGLTSSGPRARDSTGTHCRLGRRSSISRYLVCQVILLPRLCHDEDLLSVFH